MTRSLLSIGASLSLALYTQIQYANAASIKASRQVCYLQHKGLYAWLITPIQTLSDSAIQWGPCDPSIVPNPTFSCGFLEVPIALP